MGRRLFITGGASLLAMNWVKSLKDGPHKIYLGMHKRTPELKDKPIIQVDLSSLSNFCDVLDEYKIDLCLHAAGLTDVEYCQENPDKAYSVNVELSKKVAIACRHKDIQLVHISTDHLSNGLTALISERAPLCPQNTYAATKAEGEEVVRDLCPKALIIRTNFFGWGPTYRQSFSDHIIKALRAEKQISLFEDVFFTPIHAIRLARIVHELVEDRKIGIYNVVSDERISKYDFGLRLAEVFNLSAELIKPICIREMDGLTKRPVDMSLSNLKLREAIARPVGTIYDQLIELKSYEHIA